MSVIEEGACNALVIAKNLFPLASACVICEIVGLVLDCSFGCLQSNPFNFPDALIVDQTIPGVDPHRVTLSQGTFALGAPITLMRDLHELLLWR